MWNILSDWKVFLGYVKILDSETFTFFTNLFEYIRIFSGIRIIFEYFLVGTVQFPGNFLDEGHSLKAILKLCEVFSTVLFLL